MRYTSFVAILLFTVNMYGAAEVPISETRMVLSEDPQAARYLFLQQLNDICFMAPIYNCHRLEVLLKTYPLPEPLPGAEAVTQEALQDWLTAIPATEWYSRRQWFGIADPYTYAWHSVMKPDPETNPVLANYFREGAAKAPMCPHYYDADGNPFFQGRFDGAYVGGTRTDLPTVIKLATTPYCFVDTEAIDGKKISVDPLDIKAIYEKRIRELGVFESLGNIFRPTRVGMIERPVEESSSPIFSWYLFDQTTRQFVSCAEPKERSSGKRTLKFDFVPYEPTTDFGYQHDAMHRRYSPYMMGLYKFMLLRLGRDAAHNKIAPQEPTSPEVPEHPQLELHRALAERCNRDSEQNLWSDRYFSEDNFLPCMIATIFKEDRELFVAAQQAIDFAAIKPWKGYVDFLAHTQCEERLARIFKKDGTPYIQDDVLAYLPGPEQALAYIIMNTIRLLWYGTLSCQAFYKYSNPLAGRGADTYKNSAMHAYIQRFFTGIAWTYEDFVHKAGIGRIGKKSIDRDSFIDVWHRVLAAIRERSTRQYWVSFEGHGWVVILDSRLIALQKALMQQQGLPNIKHKLTVLDAIGCVGIESSHSKVLQTFYKRVDSTKKSITSSGAS